MKITLITVGKIKEKYLRDALAEYTKRLSRYTGLTIVECPDEAVKETASDAEVRKAMDKEGISILQKLPSDAYVVALAIEGRQYSSVGLAKALQQKMTEGISHFVLIIGGSCGLSPSVLQRCDTKLSFSMLTFPHQLMRVIVLEQLYRCFRIIHHEPYHK